LKSYINRIGTAVPKYRFAQKEIAQFMASMGEMNPEQKRNLEVLYRASGIQYRNSVLKDFGSHPDDLEFLGKNGTDYPGVSDRMKLFKKEALPLSIHAIRDCISDEFPAQDFTHLITVSCTGMYAPGLDIELIENLGFSTSIKRTGIHFMGCYAAFNALKVADSICRSEPDSKVLMVCVELCTIHFQNRNDEESILSNALFSDGAAAAIISGKPSPGSLELHSFYNDLEPSGKQDMTWEIADFGFEIRLSSYVPDLIKSGISLLTHNLLEHLDISLPEVDYFAIHPGGKKILKVIEECLEIEPSRSGYAHEVLRENGNMSSPTILYVLKKIIDRMPVNEPKHILAFAFGPGLTLESMLLRSV
jgi:predicted naringenin-chalcone synthase